MSDALACVTILGLAFAYLGTWQLGRRLFEHELRLEMLEEIEVVESRGRTAHAPVTLRIARTGDGPDAAA